MNGSGHGTVHLVGAGPGDLDLMTVRSLKLIARADAIVYDRLIPHGALDGARADAELHYVGKAPGRPSTDQDEINALLVELAQSGADVVRLKGGDPFVFGRGGEEALALAAAGIPFEIVPAPTAGIAGPAFAGIPVTQRGLSTAVAFVSGHEAGDDNTMDWAGLAGFPGTLVFYMGVANLAAITAGLQRAGRPGDEPAAVVSSGTLSKQRSITASLSDIAAAAEAARIKAPAITVVGPVASLSHELGWFKAASTE